MERRKWLPLALLGAAAGLLGLTLLALDLSSGAGSGQTGIPLCPLDAAAVDTVRYTQDGDAVTLQRDADGVWQLADDPALPIDGSAVETLLQNVCGMQAAQELAADAISGGAGLEAPSLALNLLAGEESFTLTVGALNTVSQSYYVRVSGRESVYTVFSGDISGLCPSRRGLYAGESPAGLAPEELTAMTVQNGAETLEFVCVDGTWQLADDPDAALDQVTVARMANTACHLKTTWAVTAPQADAAYGLDAPNAAVTLTDGKTTVTLRFGDLIPGEDEGDNGGCYLAVSSAPGTVYETEAEHLAAFAVTRGELLAQPDTADAESTVSEAALRLQGMTPEQKIGQLFLVRPDALDAAQTQAQINDAGAAGVTAVTDAMLAMLAKYPVGGVALFGKNITDETQLRTFIADLQAASGTPLFVAVDEEGGAVARLANHAAFDLPTYESAAAVGGLGEDAARGMGQTIGAYLKGYGFNMDFAPVADIDTADGPVIGARAFSSGAAAVKTLAAAMAEGLCGQGILPVFKHFPGHGDAVGDSHDGLAVLDKTVDELAAAEWLPYGYGAQPPLEKGSYAVMVGHIAVPSVTGADVPATFSGELVTDVLKAQLYDPLVITDSLAMQAITNAYTPGEAAVRALQAGCDVLLMPNGLAEAFAAVREAVQNGTLTEQRIEQSALKILQYKERYGIL